MRSRLLALVSLPLVGVVIAAGFGVRATVSAANSAGRADIFVSNAAAIAAAQAAFAREIVPAFAATVARNPALLMSGATGISTSQAVAAVTKPLPSLRAGTDVAVAALVALGLRAPDGDSFDLELHRARAGIDKARVLTLALSGGDTLQTDLASVENAQVLAATNAGVDVALSQALRDVDMIARVTQAAANEIALFSATQFPWTANLTPRRLAWVQSWLTYETAARVVAEQATPAAANLWSAANRFPTVSAYNTALDAQATTATKAVDLTTLIGLVVADGARGQTYLGVLQATLDHARAAARGQRAHALHRLWAVLVLVFLLIAASAVVAVWVRRSITVPLARLARQATRISEGELIDVQISGPAEVRTVARALSNSVATLRNIEAHAAAVTAGDLDAAVIHQPLPGPLGEVVHASVARIIGAINDREVAQLELAHRAGHDALTELPNRAQVLTLISQALHRAQRSESMTALMFIDLDHFKAVNDNFGHDTGDAVLQDVAHRMLSEAREGDTVARLGGDEFVILLENVDDEADIVALAQRIVTRLAAPLAVHDHAIRVGASVGLAFCRDGWVEADRLLQEADAAAYRAKNAGRGRVDVFDDHLRAELRHRAEQERAITAGLADGEFVLHYQPVIDLLTRATLGFEALIRWDRPGHGRIAPDDFIPTAERSALINDIGRWVLHEGTRQLAQWHASDPVTAGLSMAINISGRHLSSHDILADVIDALTQSGIDPHDLVLEVTETVLVDDPVATLNMQNLRALGIQISIDDFGTGFTSIGQLPKLPVDTLKIDRSFIASEDPAQHELVRLIVSAAHAFGLTVVAEGIETQDQADRMRTADVEYGQGYYYSRPQPPTALYPPTQSTATAAG